MFERIRTVIESGYTDDNNRRALLFNLLNIALGTVALFMSLVNFFTQETVLMYVTLIFSFVCYLNFFLKRVFRVPMAVVIFLFLLDIMILFTHFIVSGNPQGFSVLWTLLVPACAMATFGLRDGAVFCGVVLLDIIFLFWIPYGRSLLRWEYSTTFMLRFPFVYLSLMLIAMYIERVRLGTMQALKKSEAHARDMYRHDALTGMFSRHAFREELEDIFARNKDEHMAVLLMDIDDFKQINDKYGHNVGDEVLRTVAEVIESSTCEHCISCRWGGEEFLSLMQCRHNPKDVAERIRRTVENSAVTCGAETIHFTISVGIATAYTVHKNQISQFINLADKAMYVSKTTGKNKVTLRSMESKIHPLDAEAEQESFL